MNHLHFQAPPPPPSPLPPGPISERPLHLDWQGGVQLSYGFLSGEKVPNQYSSSGRWLNLLTIEVLVRPPDLPLEIGLLSTGEWRSWWDTWTNPYIEEDLDVYYSFPLLLKWYLSPDPGRTNFLPYLGAGLCYESASYSYYYYYYDEKTRQYYGYEIKDDDMGVVPLFKAGGRLDVTKGLGLAGEYLYVLGKSLHGYDTSVHGFFLAVYFGF